jgi:transcriptional regulator GlxA family with amidase domain
MRGSRPRRGIADRPQPDPRLKVGFILANQFTLTAFSAFADTLRLASDEGDRSRQILCRWTVMSSTARPVMASCGVEILPQARLLDPQIFDYIAVVGGLLHRGLQIDTETEAYLRRAAAARVRLVGVCTGSFILARAGLLEGRRCCVSWFHRQDYMDEFGGPEPVSDQLYLIDGNRITCSGGAGVADLAAALVERHVGRSAARKSLNVLMLDDSRPAGSAQPAPAFVQGARDERVRRAALLMEQSFSQPRPIGEIARQIGLSERQLDRLFCRELGAGPGEIYRAMRIDYGHWLLLHTRRTVLEIATMAGFSDGAHFSREFRKRFGVAPSGARRRLGPTPDAACEPAGDFPRRVFV